MDADTKTERENEGLNHDPSLASRPSQPGAVVIVLWEYSPWTRFDEYVRYADSSEDAETWRLKSPTTRRVEVVPVGIPEEE